MNAAVTITCMCGYGECYPAPTVADILPAAAAIAEAGWLYDDQGFAMCPECARDPSRLIVPPTAPPPDEPDLFR